MREKLLSIGGRPDSGAQAELAIDVEHGADMKAHGNVVDHEYEMKRDGDTVAIDSLTTRD